MLVRMLRFGVLAIALATASGATDIPSAPSTVVSQVTEVKGGAQLVTYFEDLPAGRGTIRTPLVAVLKDTLGDDDESNDRLREIWVFTYRAPSVWRRAASAVPFLYTRAPLPEPDATKPPRPALDMGTPSKGLWIGLTGAVVQTQFLDPISALVRLTTRSYAGNVSTYRRMHLWQALDALSASGADTGPGLSPEELKMIQGRLELSGNMFGGLVSDEYLERTYEKARARQMEARAGNWDLLRQRAEDNGLYFQPLSIAGRPVSWAMVWVAESDLGTNRPFDSKFLGISNPFRDAALLSWTGYSEDWWLDSSGAVCEAESPDARRERMIPLALYALDHPRAALLVADMRNADGPKWQERRRRFVADATVAALGFSAVGRWSYTGAKMGYSFVRGRHGVPVERLARLRAYVQVQHALAADRTLNPQLRLELAKRVNALDINPLEHDPNREAESARRQYMAFLRYVEAPDGLANRLQKDRENEAWIAAHRFGARAMLRVASFATFGLYGQSESLTRADVARFESKRREAYERRQAKSIPPAPVTVVAGTRSSLEENTQ